MQHVCVCALHPLCVQNVCACSVRAMCLQYMRLQCMYEVCACSVHTVCMQHVHVRVMCMQYVRVHAVCVPQARLTDTCMQCAYRMHAIRVCVCSVRTARMQNVCTQRTPALPAPAGIHYVGQMHEGSMLRVVLDQLTDGQLCWQRLPDPYDEVVLGPHRYQLRAGKDAFVAALEEQFPAEKAAIREFMRLSKVGQWGWGAAGVGGWGRWGPCGSVGVWVGMGVKRRLWRLWGLR